ncbi:MAG: hypothetical protein WEE50_06930 [Chloroflexota bacterium]
MPPSRLQLVMERSDEEIFEPGAISEVPLIRFAAYVASQRVFGWVRLDADRLTDLLNAHDELHLFEVGLESLPNGWPGTVDEVVIHRRDLIAVHASGPRGNTGRRQATQTHPIAIQSGSYLIGGYLHVPPGMDPIASTRSRPAMIPLTDALIEFWAHGRREHQSIGTIIVNRDRADWIRVVTHDDLIEGLLRPE